MGGEAEAPLLNLRCGGGDLAHFPRGCLVEVRTDEEDFEFVYFSATVISSSTGGRNKSKQLYVEYRDLLACEDGSDRLREHVDLSYVRPAPPSQEIVKGFEPNDVVDAFYKDGWWTGIVTRVVEGGKRFVVTFPNPPDELEFGLADLRPHWDWVNGSWVRPQKQSIAGLMFDVGRKVEVSFDREDSQDAWFPATISKDLGNGVFSVEHKDNKGEAIQARIDPLHVRPYPPLLKDKNFVLLEKVDAFFDCGWWSGVITKELENCGYIVFFKQMKQEKEFNQSDLRPHMEWKDGKWFASSQEASIPSDHGACGHNTPKNSSVSVAIASIAPVKGSVDGKDNCDRKTPSSLTSIKGHFEQSTPDNQKSPHVTAKRRRCLSDSGSTLSQPPKKLKEGNAEEAKEQDRQDKPVEEALCGFVSPDSVNNIETSGRQTTRDQSSLKSSPGEKSIKQMTVRAKQNFVGETKSTSNSIKKSGIQILCESVGLHGGGEKPNAAGKNTEEDGRNENAKEVAELPIVIGLPCPEIGSPKFGTSGDKLSHHSNGKKIETIVDGQEQQLYNSSIQETKATGGKRKRGRPRKIVVEGTQAPVSGNAQIGDVGSGDLNRKDDVMQRSPQLEVVGMEASMPDQRKIAVNKEELANDQSILRSTERTLLRVQTEEGVKESVGQGDNGSSRRGRKRIPSEKIAVQDQDPLGASGGKIMERNRTVDTDRIVGEVHSNEFVQGQNRSSRRGRKRITSEKIADQVHDPLGASGGKQMELNHIAETSTPSNESDNAPLSKWIEEMHSPSITESSRLSTEGNLEQSMVNAERQIDGCVLDERSETQPQSGTRASAPIDKDSIVPSELQIGMLDKYSEKQPESGKLVSTLADKGSTVAKETQSLPFVENTGLWKTIESTMEVFQKLPQKPHFQPLQQVKGSSSREGLAIGYMVAFASLVERTSRLQLNDPRSIVDDIMGTVAELDRHGFDVSFVQDCVSEFIEAKDKEEKLLEEVDNLNGQILEHCHEKTRFEEEIQEMKEHIRKLEEKIRVAESGKEKEDNEIASLRARSMDIEGGIENLRRDFKVNSDILR